jgi:hypothetical protein
MEIPIFKQLPSLKHVELIVDPYHWEFVVSEQGILDGGKARDEEIGAIYRAFVACKTYVEPLNPGVTCTVNVEFSVKINAKSCSRTTSRGLERTPSSDIIWCVGFCITGQRRDRRATGSET